MLKMLALFSMLGLGMALQSYHDEQQSADRMKATSQPARLPSAMGVSFQDDPQVPWHGSNRQ